MAAANPSAPLGSDRYVNSRRSPHTEGKPNILVIWDDDIGWSAEDPTTAELLKTLSYATGQFGKNHFGDMNKHLLTVHGFDEFFGNLYHPNAEEEPEQFDYPHKDQFPKLYELALPRGVLKCRAADEVSTEPDDPKFGPVGKHAIEDTGALDTKRMETIDHAVKALQKFLAKD
jgi:arylsulfatase